jgi:uncharacterized delta-60 repeat protein
MGRLKTFLAFCWLLVTPLLAAPGDVDPTFGETTRGYQTPSAFAVQADGKVLVGTSWDGANQITVNFAPYKRLARLQPDGVLDRSFNVTANFLQDVRVIVPEPDGGMLVGGLFAAQSAQLAGLARFLPDGQLDPNFSLATGSGYTIVTAIAKQGDGKILAGGTFDSYAGAPANRLVRVKPDGTRDATFQAPLFQTEGPAGSFSAGGTITQLAVQADGGILVAGTFDAIGGTRVQRLVRLLPSGAYDPTFQFAGGLTPVTVSQLEVEPGGGILLSSNYFLTYNGQSRYLARLNSDGSIAAWFSNPAVRQYSGGKFYRAPDGKIYVAGGLLQLPNNGGYSTANAFFRLQSDLTLDTTFPASEALGGYSGLGGTAGRVVIFGSFTQFSGVPRAGLASVDMAGAVTADFRPSGPSAAVTGAAVKSNGHLVLAMGASSASYDGVTASSGAVEVDASGALVRVFSGISMGGTMVAVQSDDKVLVADRYRVARFLPDGTLDPNFHYTLSFNSTISAIALQADGKLLMVGYASGVSGDPLRNGIVRLNTDGSIDSSLTTVVFNGNQLTAVLPLADGRIVVGGYLFRINGVLRTTLARVFADGTLDESFNSDVGVISVNSLAVTPGGAVLLAGQQWAVDPWSGIIRLSENGSIDRSFRRPIGLGFVETIRSIAVQGDARILIGGNFTTTNGVARSGIARLEPDGSLDSTFDPGAGAVVQVPGGRADVRKVLALPSGGVFIGGAFDLVDGVERNFAARFESAGASTAPIIGGAPIVELTGVQDGAALEFDLPVSDPSGTGLTWSPAESWLGELTFVASPGSVHVTYRPRDDVYGVESVALVATNALGQSDSVILSTTITQIDDPAVNLVPPFFETRPWADRMLFLNIGKWAELEQTPRDPLDFTYSWEIADDAGGLNARPLYQLFATYQFPITGTVYMPIAADVGKFIRATVTARDQVPYFPSGVSTILSTPWTRVGLDNTPPTIVPPEPFTVEAASMLGAEVNLSVTTSDDESGVVSTRFSPPSGRFPLGSSTGQVVVTDEAGNSTTASFTVSVLDRTAPVITPPANVSVPAINHDGSLVLYPPASVVDTVDPNPTLVYSIRSGSPFPIGTTVVTVSSTDFAGNTGTATFSVTVTPVAGALKFASAEVTARPVDALGQPTLLQVPILRSNTANGPVTVSVVTGAVAAAPGPATLVEGTDYEVASPAGGVVAFADGQTTALVTVRLKEHAAASAGRFALALSNPSGGATLAGPAVATFTIRTRDLTKPVITLTAPKLATLVGRFTVTGTVMENDALSTFTVKLNGAALPLATDPRAVSSPGIAVLFSVEDVQPVKGTNTLVIEAVDASGNKTTFTKTLTCANPRPELVGSYPALLIPTGEPAIKNTGLLVVTVAAGGSFSGRAVFAGATVPLIGQLDEAGAATFKPALGKTLALKSGAREFGTLAFTVIAAQGKPTLSGTLSTAADEVAANFTAQVASYSSKHPVPATLSGNYNLVFAAHEQTPPRPADSIPQGDGYARVTVGKTGGVVFAGFLADGSKYAASALLRADGSVALFTSLYASLGSLSGELVFADLPDCDVASVGFTWLRPPLSNAASYRGGWMNALQIVAVGTRFVPPAPFDFGQGAANSSFGNAGLTFTDTAMASALVKPISIDPLQGAVKLVPALNGGYTFVLSATTGLFTGSFLRQEGGAPRFRGILLNKGANRAGFGYYLTPPAAGAPGGAKSGRVLLDPQGQ